MTPENVLLICASLAQGGQISDEHARDYDVLVLDDGSTVGRGEVTLMHGLGLPVTTLQGSNIGFDFEFNGKNEVKDLCETGLAASFHRDGRIAIQECFFDIAGAASDMTGTYFRQNVVRPIIFDGHETFGPEKQAVLFSVFPHAATILSDTFKPSKVLSDKARLYFMIRRPGYTGYIVVEATEFDEALVFKRVTRGSTTYALRREWLQKKAARLFAMSYSYNATLVKVIDGDSVTLQVDLGFNVVITTTFQLSGLDAPEIIGAFARDAKLVKKELTEWLKTADIITVKPTGGTTGAGRWYARIGVYDKDGKGFCVNDELLSRGLAAVSTKS